MFRRLTDAAAAAPTRGTLMGQMPTTMTRALAALVAVVAVPATAQPGPAGRPPVAITRDILALGVACREAGGRPGRSPGMIQITDLTGDGVPDYVLDMNTYVCDGAASPLAAGRSPAAISIYVGSADNTARKVFSGRAYGAKVGGAPRQRVWLDLQGVDCGQQEASSLSMASQLACSRPLNWNPGTGAFTYAPVREIRPYGAPKLRGGA